MMRFDTGSFRTRLVRTSISPITFTILLVSSSRMRSFRVSVLIASSISAFIFPVLLTILSMFFHFHLFFLDLIWSQSVLPHFLSPVHYPAPVRPAKLTLHPCDGRGFGVWGLGFGVWGL